MMAAWRGCGSVVEHAYTLGDGGQTARNERFAFGDRSVMEMKSRAKVIILSEDRRSEQV